MTNQQKMILLEHLFNKIVTGVSWMEPDGNLFIKYIDGGGNHHHKMFTPEGKSTNLEVE